MKSIYMNTYTDLKTNQKWYGRPRLTWDGVKVWVDQGIKVEVFEYKVTEEQFSFMSQFLSW